MKFTKHDDNKSRLDLVPSKALEIVGFVAGKGAKKYAEENWRKCPNHKRYIAATLRHLYKHLDRKFTDRESGYLHLAHAACSALFALDLFVRVGDHGSMERKQFSYFAVVEKRGKHRAVVVKRFRSYDKAWTWLEVENLIASNKHYIRTVEPKDKVGQTVAI
jgi:hypothetical protein